MANTKSLDLGAPREEQLRVLGEYLEFIAKGLIEKPEIEEKELPGLPITLRTVTLVARCLRGWTGLYVLGKDGPPYIKPQGAFLYYDKLISEIRTKSVKEEEAESKTEEA